MARRGRPRKPGKRYANGHLVRVPTHDGGTPQIQARRRRLVGPDGDPVLSTSPIDIMAARRLIDQDTYSAALWFRATARTLFGRPHFRDSLDNSSAVEPTHAAMRWSEIRYSFLAECLEAPDRGELLDLLHFQILPHWLIRTINNGTALRAGDLDARARQLRALARLADVWKSWRDHGPRER
jgi:hypothetical protein